MQFTKRFENTLTIAITNKGSNDTTIVPNVRVVLLTRVSKLMVICLSRSRCIFKIKQGQGANAKLGQGVNTKQGQGASTKQGQGANTNYSQHMSTQNIKRSG